DLFGVAFPNLPLGFFDLLQLLLRVVALPKAVTLLPSRLLRDSRTLRRRLFTVVRGLIAIGGKDHGTARQQITISSVPVCHLRQFYVDPLAVRHPGAVRLAAHE